MHNYYLAIFAILFVFKAQALPNDTENFYLCSGKTTVSTSWNFGTAPAYCDIDPFGDPKFVQDYLNQIIFDSGESASTERNRYMNELNAVIIDAAQYYLINRKPNASQDEMEAWGSAIKTVAHQETFWSHYFEAVVDGRTKMMRGDSGHGHGMMQIDDRWHFTEINNGKGWQIFENMVYAMEIFYSEWQKAPEQSCVSAEDNWVERTRSAYSAYNGGPSKICRWLENPAWQDDGFYNKYLGASWQNYISQPELESAIDAECFMEGVEFCLPNYQAPEQPQETDEQVWWLNFLQLSSGETCLLNQGEFHCVVQAQDAVCLSAMFNRIAKAQVLHLSEQQSQQYTKQLYDRHQCMSHLQNGFKVGEVIATDKDINIRQSAGGTDTNVDTVTGQAYQVLDIVLSTAPVQERYYQIKHNSTIGYIFSGDYDTWQDWAYQGEVSKLVDENKVIALSGDEIFVAKSAGALLKTSPQQGADTLATIAKDTKLTVDDVTVQGVNNEVYYHVSHNGQNGVVYAGMLLPESNLSQQFTFSQITTPPSPPAEEPKSSSGGGGSTHGYFLWLLVGTLIFRELLSREH
ncbi:hypothetical protein [Thalassotalea sp. G2M2-11]|uniref:hypothetical protein n=1 Tax=Thalassotalea sp. G2M2-11 TaxID=2787627 RepID=UPI0019CFEFE7|nr:hypothetical protein [Thalassotalea sp. G2M2-11]